MKDHHAELMNLRARLVSFAVLCNLCQCASTSLFEAHPLFSPHSSCLSIRGNVKPLLRRGIAMLRRSESSESTRDSVIDWCVSLLSL